MNGSPAVQAFWRRQGIKPAAQAQATTATENTSTNALSDSPAIEIAPETSPAEISKQIEPAVQMILSQGKVQDAGKLRSELQRAVGQFQQMVQAVATDQGGSTYWVSGFRIDLSISASGSVSFGTFGVDTRLRLEWKRAMRAQPKTPSQRLVAQSIDPSTARMQESLKEFIHNIALDLEDASTQNPPSADFKPYSFRVGLGMSMSGDLGFASGSGSLIGHINFSRDTKKPVVYPVQPTHPGAYLLIEKATAAQLSQHLAFAHSHGIPVKTAPSDLAFMIDRARFRKGLSHAMKMGSFFAEHAGKANSSSPQWKIFDLRLGLDLSLTGGLTLGTNKLQATTEMGFYNQSF
jgi:hypothetical protein